MPGFDDENVLLNALLKFTMSVENLDVTYDKYTSVARAHKDITSFKDKFSLGLNDAIKNKENMEHLIAAYLSEAKDDTKESRRIKTNNLDTLLTDENYNGCKSRLEKLNKNINKVLPVIDKQIREFEKLDELEGVQKHVKAPTFFEPKRSTLSQSEDNLTKQNKYRPKQG